jgi:hypothetical protein
MYTAHVSLRINVYISALRTWRNLLLICVGRHISREHTIVFTLCLRFLICCVFPPPCKELLNPRSLLKRAQKYLNAVRVFVFSESFHLYDVAPCILAVNHRRLEADVTSYIVTDYDYDTYNRLKSNNPWRRIFWARQTRLSMHDFRILSQCK